MISTAEFSETYQQHIKNCEAKVKGQSAKVFMLLLLAAELD
jgi:hypothetical protein